MARTRVLRRSRKVSGTAAAAAAAKTLTTKCNAIFVWCQQFGLLGVDVPIGRRHCVHHSDGAALQDDRRRARRAQEVQVPHVRCNVRPVAGLPDHQQSGGIRRDRRILGRIARGTSVVSLFESQQDVHVCHRTWRAGVCERSCVHAKLAYIVFIQPTKTQTQL